MNYYNEIKSNLIRSELYDKAKDYSKVFGDKLVELAKKNEKIVAITASMKDGTGIKLKFILKQENYYMKQVKNMVKVLLNNLLLS